MDGGPPKFEPSPTTIGVREQHLQTVCLLFLTGVAGAAGLYWLRPVLIPFVLAFLIAICLTPFGNLFVHRLGAPRFLGLIATVTLGCVVLLITAAFVSTFASRLTRNVDDYQEQYRTVVDRTIERLPLEKFGVDEDQLSTALLDLTRAGLGQLMTGTAVALMNLLSNGLLVVIFMGFMLAGMVGSPRPQGLRGDIQKRIQRYVITKVIISAVTGAGVGLILHVMGVHLAFVFGLLAFLLNFIPSIGSLIATALPIPVIMMQEELSTTTAVLAVALPGTLQIIIGNFIEPRIMGQSLDLHPIVILMALIFFGMIWGPIGMLLATPLAAVAKMALDRVPTTAPIGKLLAGRLEGLQELVGDED